MSDVQLRVRWLLLWGEEQHTGASNAWKMHVHAIVRFENEALIKDQVFRVIQLHLCEG